MTRKTKSAIMADVSATESRIVAPNTVEYRTPDGDRVVRLHRTDIVTFKSNGDIVLSSGGWRTVTTKDRINRFAPVRVHAERGVWYVSNGDAAIPFVDGLTLRRGKLPKPSGRAVAKQTKLAAAIAKFADQLREGEIPAPNNGDCWFCLMFDRDTKPGGKVNDPGHLAEHVRENYMHGSLVMNALSWAGYPNPALIVHMNIRTSIVSAVRRYLRRQLGLG